MAPVFVCCRCGLSWYTKWGFHLSVTIFILTLTHCLICISFLPQGLCWLAKAGGWIQPTQFVHPFVLSPRRASASRIQRLFYHVVLFQGTGRWRSIFFQFRPILQRSSKNQTKRACREVLKLKRSAFFCIPCKKAAEWHRIIKVIANKIQRCTTRKIEMKIKRCFYD